MTPPCTAVAAPAAPTRFRFLPDLRFGAWLGRPMTSFHLLISVSALLVTLGLTMVLSASGVHSYDEDGSPWAIFGRQVLWTVVGLFGFWFALRVSRVLPAPHRVLGVRHHDRATRAGAHPGHRARVQRHRGWFVVAGLSMQPSELTKIAFAIWGAHLLATRRMERASLREMLIPLIPPP